MIDDPFFNEKKKKNPDFFGEELVLDYITIHLNNVPVNFTFNYTVFDLEDFINEIVIINTNTGSYYSISGSAVSVLRWFFVPISHLQIERFIQETFPSEVKEACTFVEWLKRQDLIRTLETPEDTVGKALPSNESKDVILGDWTYCRFDDMSDLIRLDPIHDVSDVGWPHRKNNDS